MRVRLCKPGLHMPLMHDVLLLLESGTKAPAWNHGDTVVIPHTPPRRSRRRRPVLLGDDALHQRHHPAQGPRAGGGAAPVRPRHSRPAALL